MKQINCTVAGVPTDVPYLTVDNGHVYHGMFPSDSRVQFNLADSEPGWGATIFYGGQTIRLLVPPSPGAYEGPLLQYGPAPSRLQRVRVDGDRFVTEDGAQWTWAMMTGFCDYQKWLDGEDLGPLWDQAGSLGANGRRIFGMMSYITGFNPADYGESYYTRLPEFFADMAEHGLYGEFDVFADAQIIMADSGRQQEHWARCADVLRSVPTVFLSGGNEYQKNGFDPTKLAAPIGLCCSPGSSVSDTAPPMIGAWPNAYRAWHGRRDQKVFLSTDDMWYVGAGFDEQHGQYAAPAPAVHEEPMGAAEIDIPGRRSTNARLFESLAYSSIALGRGATFHAEDAIYSRLLGPIQQACARAFYKAMQ